MRSKITLKNKLEEEEQKRKEKDVVKMWTPYEDKVDEDYHFINNNIFYKIFSNFLLYIIATPILYIYNKVCFGFKIEGRENLKKVKVAKITVSNHIHILDCTMCAIAITPTKLFFPTIADNFRIPFIKTLVKLLNAIPIPTTLKAKEKFIEAIIQLLKKGETVHFFPEGNLIPYDKELREFKTGAFKISAENNVPILPMVFKYRNPKWYRKLFNKKPLLTLEILEPVYPNNEIENKKEKIDLLVKQVRKSMKSNI